MRSLRAVLIAAFVAVTALVGSSGSLLAASGNGNAEPWRYPFAWDYCWNGGGPTEYCFDMNGQMVVTEFADGSSFATITSRQTTVIKENGVVVGQVAETQVDKSKFDGFGQVYLQSIAHTRSTTADGEKCVITSVLKIVDFQVVVDAWNGPGCN
jgi:hypothetical protein